jgi:protein-L-isoaspartate O-methyltransferase
MASQRASGTEGYAEEADDLLERYERRVFADLHKSVSHLIPNEPCSVLDIGAGTGRDAAGFAAIGHRVLAVEPTEPLRKGGMALHTSSSIEWVDDSLPDLALIVARQERFEVVMMTAVWMHLDERQRRQAMPRAASLVSEDGVLIMSLRHGPVPQGRRMFDVSSEETVQLASEQNLHPIINLGRMPDHSGRGDVSWTRLAFQFLPQDA